MCASDDKGIGTHGKELTIHNYRPRINIVGKLKTIRRNNKLFNRCVIFTVLITDIIAYCTFSNKFYLLFVLMQCRIIHS